MVLRINYEMDNAIQASTASARVFAVPELLEHILIRTLPERPSSTDRFSFPAQSAQATSIRTLYILQRVSKTFSSTIQRSQTCRHAMHLEYAYPGDVHDKEFLQIKPLIFHLCLIQASIRWRIAKKQHLLCQYTMRTQDLESFYDSPLVQELLFQLTWEPMIGSWQRILLSNMPVKLEFNFNISDGRDYSRGAWYHLLNEGATFAELVLTFVEDVRFHAGWRRRNVDGTKR